MSIKLKLCSLEEAKRMERLGITNTGIDRGMFRNFGTVISINEESNIQRFNEGRSIMYEGYWYHSKWYSRLTGIKYRN